MQLDFEEVSYHMFSHYISSNYIALLFTIAQSKPGFVFHLYLPIPLCTMSDNQPPHDMQAEFLYDIRWSKDIDNHFIDIISFQHNIGNFAVGKKNISAIGMAIDSISRRFDVDFSYQECQAKIAKMFRRYSTFSWMLNHDEFMYDPASKYVHSPQRIWDFFFLRYLNKPTSVHIWIFVSFHEYICFAQSNHFSMAYRFTGDPKWGELSSIYGPREPSPPVIVVSSNESEENRADGLVREAPSAAPARSVQNDFAEPPPSILSRNIQRSMWDYVGYASDSDDGNTDGIGSSANSRKEMRRLRYAEQLQTAAPSSVRNRTPSGSINNSSCASNDPYEKRRL